MSKQHSTFSKGRNFTINSFDIVAVFGNEVERCFDIVAGVNVALFGGQTVEQVVRGITEFCR